LFIGDGIQYLKEHTNEFDVIITDAPDDFCDNSWFQSNTKSGQHDKKNMLKLTNNLSIKAKTSH
jgi:spermidine synthase